VKGVDRPAHYRHPGQAFIARYGGIQIEQDVQRYVEFLRQEAGLSNEPPIHLDAIYQHFGMPAPLRAPLTDQQGILVDSQTGIILIKEDDPGVRQRFTEGHELMELLFDAQEQLGQEVAATWEIDEGRKEQLCDRGAADLLMPQSSFVPRLQELGISLDTGCALASLYQTSLLATLIRMMQYGTSAHALVMWHYALKPTELKRLKDGEPEPRKKLRVWWRTWTKGWRSHFIPKDKSISLDSPIYRAYRTGRVERAVACLDLGQGKINCQVEAMPMQIGVKDCVLSVLHSIEK